MSDPAKRAESDQPAGDPPHDTTRDRLEPEPPRQPPPERLLTGLMVAVLIWGLLLAVGAFFFPVPPTSWSDPRAWMRFFVVLACVGLFLAWWIWLVRRKPRPRA